MMSSTPTILRRGYRALPLPARPRIVPCPRVSRGKRRTRCLQFPEAVPPSRTACGLPNLPRVGAPPCHISPGTPVADSGRPHEPPPVAFVLPSHCARPLRGYPAAPPTLAPPCPTRPPEKRANSDEAVRRPQKPSVAIRPMTHLRRLHHWPCQNWAGFAPHAPFLCKGFRPVPRTRLLQELLSRLFPPTNALLPGLILDQTQRPKPAPLFVAPMCPNNPGAHLSLRSSKSRRRRFCFFVTRESIVSLISELFLSFYAMNIVFF